LLKKALQGSYRHPRSLQLVYGAKNRQKGGTSLTKGSGAARMRPKGPWPPQTNLPLIGCAI